MSRDFHPEILPHWKTALKCDDDDDDDDERVMTRNLLIFFFEKTSISDDSHWSTFSLKSVVAITINLLSLLIQPRPANVNPDMRGQKQPGDGYPLSYPYPFHHVWPHPQSPYPQLSPLQQFFLCLTICAIFCGHCLLNEVTLCIYHPLLEGLP